MKEYVFVGTYTNTTSKGIYGFAQENGYITEPVLLAVEESPTYLCVNKAGTILYSVEEPETGCGKVASYDILRDEDGQVKGLERTSLREAPSLGGCHVVLTPDEKFLIVTTYVDATVQVYEILADGSVGKLCYKLIRQGKGPNPDRQEKAHAHSVTFAPDGSFFYLCDLGTDHLAAYRLTDAGEVVSIPEKTVDCPPGYGPRHMVFSPDGAHAYVAAEIVDHLLHYVYEDGRMLYVQDLLATRDQDPANTSAAVRVSSDGRFVYISNRGENTITVYRVRPDGTLLQIQRLRSQGRTPREFALSLDETVAYAGNQDSDTLSIFLRDPETGLLKTNGVTKAIGSPVAIVSVPNGQMD